MGIVRMGIPEDITLFLKQEFSINTFIETGTYKGGTALWAKSHFSSVYTIEFSKQLYDDVCLKHKSSGISFIFGNSKDELQALAPRITEPVLLWLDAHWCGQNSYGENDQCPLLDELQILKTYHKNSCILIDDARLFLSPPPQPNEWMSYPTIAQIIKQLDDRYTIIYEDVIISIPISGKKALGDFMQKKATEQLNKDFSRNRSKYTKIRGLLADIYYTIKE